ncbi:MAG: hypothetical protein AAF555_00155 [Verrucomicrobiota bacterium]
MDAQALNAWIGQRAKDRTSPTRLREKNSLAVPVGSTAAVFLALLLLLGMTFFKEMPIFWRNAGGYPIWLREVIGLIYYPWLLFSLACLGGWNVYLFCWMVSRPRWLPLCGTLIGSAWLILTISVVWLGWNNLENVFEGRHYNHHGNPTLVE